MENKLKNLSKWFDSAWKKCKGFLRGNRVILICFTILIFLVIGNCYHILDRIWNFPEAYYHDNYINDPYNMKGRVKAVSDTLNFKDKLVFVSEKREKIFTGFLVLLGIILTAWRSYELFKQNRNNDRRITHEKEENDKRRDHEKEVSDKSINLQQQKLKQEQEDNEEKREQERDHHNKNILLQQFSTASELLNKSGDENIAARLSGIYLFEKIMNTNEDYHWQIVELLTAYVREKRDNRFYDTENPLSSNHPNIENLPYSDKNFYTVSENKIEFEEGKSEFPNIEVV